ncbi:MAG: LPS export ABC transporter periplasmic protein LptC [Candidatus Omnitrophota bacterium]
MRLRKTTFVSLIFAVFLIVLLAVVVDHKKKAQRFNPRYLPAKDEKTKATQDIDVFLLVGYKEDGSKKWEVKGATAEFITESVIKLTDIVAKAYGEENELTVVSDFGTVDQKAENIHLEQNVVATTDEGTKLTTDYLDYNKEEGVIYTEADVWIERRNITAFGTGAYAKQLLNAVELKKNIGMMIGPTIIVCDGPVNLDYVKNIAVFYDNVVVIDEQGHVLADRMDVYYDPKAKEINQVFAVGNVEIIKGENITYTEEAIYDTASGSVIFHKRPKLIISPEKEEEQKIRTTE